MSKEKDIKQDIPFHETQEYKDSIEQFKTKLRTSSFAKKELKGLAVKSSSSGGMNRGGGKRFKVEDIEKWLLSPASSEESLRKLSIHLYNANSVYRWLVNILAGMPTWAWTLSMNSYNNSKNKQKLVKAYRETLEWADSRYNAHELSKAWKTVIKEDWFYAYEIETPDTCFFLKLDPKFCKVTSIVEGGVRAFSFDFSFFDDKEEVLPSYPLEMQKGYAQYLRTGEQWIPLDPLNTICWKLNAELDYGLPYFANIFPSLADVGFYKDLAKNKAEIDSFMLLHGLIPVDENGFNKFAVDLDLADDFDATANSVLPDGVAMISTPFKTTAIKTESSKSDGEKVKEAVDNVYTGAGIPQQLSNSNTLAGLRQAIIANEQVVFDFFRQVENTFNLKLRYKITSGQFKMRIQDVTKFNQFEKSKELLTGAQNGLIPASHVASAMGSNPYEFMNEVDMENDLLDLTSRLKPLKTSHTLTAEDTKAESSSNKKDDKDATDSTIVSRETEANEKREE